MSETQVILVRYWAAARAAAGTAEDALEVAGPLSLADVRREVVALHPGSDGGERLAAVLKACSVLVGATPAGTRDPAEVVVHPGESVEFLPPFAGGASPR